MSKHHDYYTVTVYGDDPNAMKVDAVKQALAFYGADYTAEITNFGARPLEEPERTRRQCEHFAAVTVKVTGNDIMTPAARAGAPVLYAYEVLGVLEERGGFDRAALYPGLIDSVSKQFTRQDPHYEFIVDSPHLANWKLVPVRENGYRQFVELACWKAGDAMSDKDRARLSDVNSRLADLGEDF